MAIPDFRNKRVAILGYGVNNAELVPFLQSKGAHVMVRDKNEALAEKLSFVEHELGSDIFLKNLDSFDFIFRTPGLPYLTPELQAAQKKGTTLTSQTELFLQACPASVIAVTGTKGKGTTSSLIASCLEAGKKREELNGNVYLAGNIGTSPIGLLDTLKENDWVVLELSSFQTQGLTVSPYIAVILNITADHLDHHKDVAEYHSAKQDMVRNQTPEDHIVVNHDSRASMEFLDVTHAQPHFFSRFGEVHDGAYIADNMVWLCRPDLSEVKITPTADIKLPGDFNLENVTAATAAAALTGISTISIKEGLTSFTGMAHRLQLVGEKSGVQYYDDSKASTPDSAIAAFQSFDQPITLILGGSSKGADFTELIQALPESSVKQVITIGEEGERIAELIQKHRIDVEIIAGAKTMKEIVHQASKTSEKGGIVLLSPACASFDMFKSAEDRGEQFQQAVKELA